MQETSKILGPDGRPVKRAILTQEHGEPTVGGVRNIWRENVAKGLDPAKLARILQQADEGDNEQFLVLAEEMEERDTHYASVLGQRKRAISLIEPIVTGQAEGGDEDIVEAVEALVAAPTFPDMVDDLLDGIAKGYAVCDINWELGENQWMPKSYSHRDPRFFRFDPETAQELRIKHDAFPHGKPIPQYAMIIHRPKLKSGITLRSGLARLVSWAFMLKAFTMQDWAAFLEVFGMPLRVGKYGSQASPEEKRTLLRAVRDLGSDAAAIIPENMMIEFIEAKGGTGNAVFGDMAGYLDKQISKAVLGQTMTTDDGSSLSQAKVHEGVKIDIKKSDARQTATTINRDLIAPFVAFNYGPQAPVPVATFPVDDPEDIKAMSEALANLVPVGLKVGMGDVRKKMGFAKPADDEEILVPIGGGAGDGSEATNGGNKENQPPPNALSDSERTANRQKPGVPRRPGKAGLAARKNNACQHCGEVHLAGNAEPQTLVDALAEESANNWEADIGPVVAQILAAANDSSDYETFLQRLNQMDPATNQLAKTLAIQAMKAKGDGNLGNS